MDNVLGNQHNGPYDLPALLIRPALKWDECPVGFQARVAALNGIRLGVLEACVSRQKVCTHAFGHPLPAWAWKYRGHRHFTAVCMRCLAENGYIKQTWRISHIDVCPQHHTMLEPSLDSDHRRCKLRDLYWRLNDPDFRSRNVVPAAYSAAEWQIFYSIWPWLGSRCAIEPNALAISVFVAALLKRLAYASRDRSISTRHVPLWTQISQWIQSSNLRICTSVSGVDRLFQQLHSSLHQAVAYRFLKEVTAAEKVQRSIIATLPLSRWLAQLEFTLYAAPGTLTKVGMQAADGLPLHEVVNELDISSAKLRFLLEILGTEPFMTVRARHRHLRMFSPKDANSLKAAAADICMRKEAVTHLHLNHPRPLLPVLCRTGHLRRVQAGHHEFYLRSQMNELLRNLSRHAARFEGQTSLSLHDPLLYKAVDGIAVDELLADICAGRVDVWHDQTAAGLKSLRVPWSVRERLEARTRQIRTSQVGLSRRTLAC